MKKILVTGGTTFVSKYVAEYFVTAGYEVYVLNRNTKPQVRGVKLIEGDRHNPGDLLKDIAFDVIADITAYNAIDVMDLVKALGSFEQYIMISSSAVYPEYGVQPFLEESEKSVNKFWGTYGTDNNVYREAFVFDCALADRKFYLPKDGDMKLQFFHIKDLCRLMEVIIKHKPDDHILNVGNKEAVSIKDWVIKCYESLGKIPTFVNVYEEIEQRNYFSFYNYEYYLDVTRQSKIYPETISLEDGLKDAAKWYLEHRTEVNKKPYFEYIDSNLEFVQMER
ncbi:MAG: dTDP-glucose 4,6-dehydratase [Eubacteriales bacterium]|nr:dTDP-glucose 4,6-dehydratase [Eubacteriales bacterium]